MVIIIQINNVALLKIFFECGWNLQLEHVIACYCVFREKLSIGHHFSEQTGGSNTVSEGMNLCVFCILSLTCVLPHTVLCMFTGHQ